MLGVQATPAQAGTGEAKARPLRMAQRPVSTGCFSCEQLREMYGGDRPSGTRDPAPAAESRWAVSPLGGAVSLGVAGGLGRTGSAELGRALRALRRETGEAELGDSAARPSLDKDSQGETARAAGAPGGNGGLPRRWESLGAHEGAAWRQRIHSPGKSRLSRTSCSMPPETTERTGAAGTRLAVARGKETEESSCVEIFFFEEQEKTACTSVETLDSLAAMLPKARAHGSNGKGPTSDLDAPPAHVAAHSFADGPIQGGLLGNSRDKLHPILAQVIVAPHLCETSRLTRPTDSPPQATPLAGTPGGSPARVRQLPPPASSRNHRQGRGQPGFATPPRPWQGPGKAKTPNTLNCGQKEAAPPDPCFPGPARMSSVGAQDLSRPCSNNKQNRRPSLDLGTARQGRDAASGARNSLGSSPCQLGPRHGSMTSEDAGIASLETGASLAQPQGNTRGRSLHGQTSLPLEGSSSSSAPKSILVLRSEGLQHARSLGRRVRFHKRVDVFVYS